MIQIFDKEEIMYAVRSFIYITKILTAISYQITNKKNKKTDKKKHQKSSLFISISAISYVQRKSMFSRPLALTRRTSSVPRGIFGEN